MMQGTKQQGGHAAATRRRRSPWLLRTLPFLAWFEGYSVRIWRADLIAGLTVAVVLVPQSMAYAQLAGLPAYYGLYAALFPPAIAALFGSSRQLATGPVAMVSLMTATALEPLAAAGSEGFIAYAFLLAFMVGLFQFLLGVLRLGLVVNLLSHSVVVGFTNAGALIIATSQLAKFMGVHAEKAERHYETVWNVVRAALSYVHWPTLIIGVLSLALMTGLRRVNKNIPGVLVAATIAIMVSWATGLEKNAVVRIDQIASVEVRDAIHQYNKILARIADLGEQKRHAHAKYHQALRTHRPHSLEVIELKHEEALLALRDEEAKEEARSVKIRLTAMLFEAVTGDDGKLLLYRRGELPANRAGTGHVWRLRIGSLALDEAALTFVGGGAVVGKIPRGPPGLVVPDFDLSVIQTLLPMAIIISLVGFMEAISIAKVISARTGQRLDPNQELIGQGLANILGSFARTYPVSGSFSRSAVNLHAGAVTGLSNVVCSVVVLAVLLFLTDTLYHLPQSVLAAVIMRAVIGLVSVRPFAHAWRIRKDDGIVAMVTFAATLYFAPHLDVGIMTGVVLSLAFWILRQMKPRTAILAMYADGSYRDSEKHQLRRCKHILALRFNGALLFANAIHLEQTVLRHAAAMPELKHILIVGNGIDEIDAAGEGMLSSLVRRWRESGYHVYISGLNDAVMDVMERAGLYDTVGEENFFRNVRSAVEVIRRRASARGEAGACAEGECPLQTVLFTDDAPKAPTG